jgi:serine/threonine-protein kinase
MQLYKFLWIVPFLAFASGYIAVRSLLQADSIPTPALVGTDIHQAVAILSNYDLNARILNEKEDPDLPHGTIISQNPSAGNDIKPRQSVFLVVSKQPPIMSAPLYIGQSITDIRANLKKLGLKSRVYEFQHTHPQGSCFAQIPAPNQPLDQKMITLYISAGRQQSVLFPNFIGRPLPEVTDFLERHGIKPAITHHPAKGSGHTCQECLVADQRPLPGSLLLLDETNPPHVQLRI